MLQSKAQRVFPPRKTGVFTPFPPHPILHGRVGPPPRPFERSVDDTKRSSPVPRSRSRAVVPQTLDRRRRDVVVRRSVPGSRGTPDRTPSSYSSSTTLPRGDVGSGGGGTSSSSAEIRRFPRSPRPLAPLMRWASRASSSPSPRLRRPPNPPSSAASSRASPPIPTASVSASVVGRSSFFAIAGRRGRRHHRQPRLRPPP